MAAAAKTYPKHPATYRARLLASLALQEQGKLPEAQELLIDNLYRIPLAPQSSDWRDSLFALRQLCSIARPWNLETQEPAGRRRSARCRSRAATG